MSYLGEKHYTSKWSKQWEATEWQIYCNTIEQAKPTDQACIEV